MCWLCHEEAHAPFRCSDALRWKKVAKIELLEDLNDAWEKSNTKPCPACNKANMTCPCGYEFCWICGKAWGSKACGGYMCTKEGWVDQYVEKAPDDKKASRQPR